MAPDRDLGPGLCICARREIEKSPRVIMGWLLLLSLWAKTRILKAMLVANTHTPGSTGHRAL